MRKIRFSAILLGCLLLAGCGQQTPLSHALKAFRAGDVVEFMRAQVEANEAVKTAIQPGGDLCRVSGADVAKYNAVQVIELLNRPALFQRSEEERLVYALAAAGHGAKVWPGSFLEQAPIMRAGAGHDTSCGTNGQAMTAMMEGGPFMQADNEARMNVLDGWIHDLKQKHGSGFDAEMQAVAGRLSFEGYQASWPPDVDFGEYYSMPTFKQVQDSVR